MILVTGGAGFIGANFILEWLALHDEPVLNIDKLTYAGNYDNLRTLEGDERHIFLRGDIADSKWVSRVLAKHRPRAILNFAAESHVDRSIDAAEAFVQTNVVGTFRLLEAARAYWSGLDADGQSGFRYLQASTDEVYGSLTSSAAAFREEDRYEPNSPYAASKAAADHFVRASYRTWGLPVLTTNCANNYGPFQFPEKLIPLMVFAALEDRPMPLYGDGLQVRDWLYVKDHCSAIRRVLEAGRPGQTYNVGAEGERTNLAVVLMICTLLDDMRPTGRPGGYASLVTHVADRPGHDVRYAIDASKIRRELGWQPEQNFESGLRQTVHWYLDRTDWLELVRARGHALSRNY